MIGPSASQLPRQIDFVIHERLVRRRRPHPAGLGRLGAANSPMIHALAAFLRNYAGLPPDINSALTGRTVDEESTEPLSAEAEEAVTRLALEADGTPASLIELGDESEASS